MYTCRHCGEQHPGTEIPEIRCAECGGRMNTLVAIVLDAPPNPGDFNICGRCGAFAVFNQDLQLVEPSPEQLAGVTAEMLAFQAKIRQRAAKAASRVFEEILAGNPPGRMPS